MVDASLEPVLLEADNFTPASRTPWGGTQIVETYKPGLLPADGSAAQVGESWEVSLADDFPSRVVGDGRRLTEIVTADPSGWLGAAELSPTQSSLLVKLIDTADVLSLQVHPDDAYASADGERSGKYECWYVLERRPGAGLYIGFRQGIGRDEVASALSSGQDIAPLLYFASVEPGDFFLIEEGTPHAIGAGVTLLEAQRVRFGQNGITYRFWDWNRLYDAQGKLDLLGRPRDLHLSDALAVSRWDGPREEALLQRIRRRCGAAQPHGMARIEALGDGIAAAATSPLELWRLQGSGDVPWPLPVASFAGLTVLAGGVQLHSGAMRLDVGAGRSAAVPAAATIDRVELHDAHALLCTTRSR